MKWSYSQRCFNAVQRCENRRWKWQRCFDVVSCCLIQRWNTQRCFNVVECCEFQRWRTQRCFNIDLTLWDVATSYQPKSNVEPTSKCLLGSYLLVLVLFVLYIYLYKFSYIYRTNGNIWNWNWKSFFDETLIFFRLTVFCKIFLRNISQFSAWLRNLLFYHETMVFCS